MVTNKEYGFTLTEILIASAVASIILIAALMLFKSGSSSAKINSLKTAALKDARQCIESITSEMSKARFASVDIMTPGKLSFSVSAQDGIKEISFIHDLEQLKKTIVENGIEQNYVIARNVSDFSVEPIFLDSGENERGKYNIFIEITIPSPFPKFDDILVEQSSVCIVAEEIRNASSWSDTGL